MNDLQHIELCILRLGTKPAKYFLSLSLEGFLKTYSTKSIQVLKELSFVVVKLVLFVSDQCMSRPHHSRLA